MKILLSITHPHVIPNLYKFISYVEHKRRYFEEPNCCLSQLTSIVEKEILCQWGPSSHWLPAFFKLSSFMFNIRKNYTGLVYRFGTTWGWVNDDKILFMVNGKQTQTRGSAQTLSSTPPTSSPIKITLRTIINEWSWSVSYQIYDFWNF